MRMIFLTGLLSLQTFCAVAWAEAKHRPVIVFDMDHTLVDTNCRIVVLIREIGSQLALPNLANVQYPQIEALRLGDPGALGTLTDEQTKLIFGSRSQGDHKQSLFGQKFYFDSSYLKYDSVNPGAPEFVARLADDADADIVYLTGRLEPYFCSATVAQLKRFNFPGFGRQGYRAKLILKPLSAEDDTDRWKLSVLEQIARQQSVLAVFDDSKRNANLLAREFPKAVIVRITRDVLNRTGLDERVEQMSTYHENIANQNGQRTVHSNQAQLKQIVERIKTCRQMLENF